MNELSYRKSKKNNRKLLRLTLIISVLGIILFSSYQFYFKEYWNQKNQNGILNDTYSNTKLYKLDTVYNNVKINNFICTIKIVKEKFDENQNRYKEESEENWWLNEAPTLIVIYDNSNNKIIYNKKFEEVGTKVTISKQSDDFSKNGNLYLHLISSGGGSGFTAWTYRFISNNNKIELQELFESNELTSIFFNQNEKEAFLIQGDWEVSEGHFGTHKQQITVYQLTTNNFTKQFVGNTENSYEMSNEIINNIAKNEQLLKFDTNKKFVNFNNWEGKFENIVNIKSNKDISICNEYGNNAKWLEDNGYLTGPNSGSNGECKGLNIHTETKWINTRGIDSLYLTTFQHRLYDKSKIYDENNNLIWQWDGENSTDTWYTKIHKLKIRGNDKVRLEFFQGYDDYFCNGYLKVTKMICL
jgi:hypothetical protein